MQEVDASSLLILLNPIRKKKKKCKLYYSSEKELEKSRMAKKKQVERSGLTNTTQVLSFHFDGDHDSSANFPIVEEQSNMSMNDLEDRITKIQKGFKEMGDEVELQSTMFVSFCFKAEIL